MSPVRVNLMANIFGRGGLGLVHLLTIPVYLAVFSAEEYGMIGLYLSFLPAFLAVSTGLNAAFNRTTAQWRAGAFNERDYHDLALSLEIVCWCAAFFLFLAMLGLSGPISSSWLNVSSIPLATLQLLLLLMAGSLCCQVPMSVYVAGLNGLQVHVVSNTLQFSSALFQGVGGVLVVVFVSRTLEAYFAWLLLVNFLAVLMARSLYARRTHPVSRRRPRWGLLKRIAGMSVGSERVSLFMEITSTPGYCRRNRTCGATSYGGAIRWA